MRIAARELRQLDGLRGAVARPRGLLHRLRRLVPDSTPAGARRHISAHYDLGNDLFAAFLDERMMYSCAYFPRRGTSLEEAQLEKLERICSRLRLGPGNHLLEIGTGGAGWRSTPRASTAAWSPPRRSRASSTSWPGDASPRPGSRTG
jgi:cyclopropane-fatty-acyl-phospholipid synthase